MKYKSYNFLFLNCFDGNAHRLFQDKGHWNIHPENSDNGVNGTSVQKIAVVTRTTRYKTRSLFAFLYSIILFGAFFSKSLLPTLFPGGNITTWKRKR